MSVPLRSAIPSERARAAKEPAVEAEVDFARLGIDASCPLSLTLTPLRVGDALQPHHPEESSMLLTETQTEAAFADYLTRDGWTVSITNADFIDVVATKGTTTLIAEVKGHTKSAGAAVDIGYGQLLRRMADIDGGLHRYALVVPATLRKHAERVPEAARRRLGIELWVVAEDGGMTQL
jgi:hypothetical protein